MDQFVLLLVVGAIGLIKWLMEKSAEQRTKRETAERLEQIGRGEPAAPPQQRTSVRPIDSFPRGDDPMRRLREALGIPEEIELPPPRQPGAAPQVPAFHVEEVKVIPVPDLEQRLVQSAASAVPEVAAPSLIPELHTERTPEGNRGLDELLRTRGGLRKAILVQEILGTPKGLVF